MKLTKFTIKNFRSITDGGQINLKDQSVLVGRNNEGKTTVLRKRPLNPMSIF